MNTTTETSKLNSQGFFKKESHYAWVMVLLVTCHVIYMTYFFPREWADTPTAMAFVNAIASFVPVIENLQQNIPLYTNYWGMFYATFWITYPIYIFLGIAGSFYLSPYRYKKLIIEASLGRVWAMLAMFFLCAVFFVFFPVLSLGIFINQMSIFLPKLILSWLSTAGSGYVLARIAMALVIRSNLNHQR